MKINFSLLLVILIIFIFKGNVFAQTSEIDNLRQKISNFKQDDTVKLKSLLLLSHKFLTRQVDSALKYGELSKKLAIQLGYKKFQLEAYDYLGRAYYGKGNFKQALNCFLLQEKLATSNVQKAQVVRNQGNIYIELGKPNEALNLYQKSLALANLGKDKLTIALSLANIAYVLRQQAKYDQAISYLLKALKIGEELNNKPFLAGTYIQLAMIQYNRKIYNESQNYATEALKLYEQLDNKQGQATSFTIIGGCYSEKNNFPEANKYILEAYKLNVALGDKRQIATSAQNLAEIKLLNKDYNQALDFANQSIKGLKELGVINNLISAYLTRGKIYITLNELKKAELDISEGLLLSRSGSYRAQERKAIEAKALLKAAEGNYSDAFSIILTANLLNDSLLNETNAKQINELRTKYETEKKQQEIVLLNEKNKSQLLTLSSKDLEIDKQILSINNQKLDLINKDLKIAKNESNIKQKSLETKAQREKIKVLKQQSTIQNLELRQRNLLLIVAVSILVLGAILTYLLFSRRKLKAKAELQIEVNRQQDLAARAVLDAEERERRRIASDLHDGVGQILSVALMNMNGLFKKLTLTGETAAQAEQTLGLVNDSYDEMRSISHQMMPNALIKSGLASAVKEFLGKIDKHILKINLETIGLNKRLEEQVETVLYRVIQESVNNIIKHAEADKLNIILIKDDEGVSATIEDNGKGFDKNKLKKKSGLGLSNIYSRVEFLKGTVDIDTAPGKGTLIAIHIPV